MTTDYQLGLLRYLVQSSEGVTYIDSLEPDLFDLYEYQMVLQVLQMYKKKYASLPGRISGIQFMDEQIALTRDLTPEFTRDLREVMEDLYEPLPDSDKIKLRDTLILEVQNKSIDRTFMDFAEGRLTVDQVFGRFNKLSALAQSDADNHTDGGLLVADRSLHTDDQVSGHPTFLHDLNTLTAARGFYSPQLIVFMSGPKHFKTGLLIKLAVEYARDGYKVYYADGENSARSIRNRSKMAIMKCTLSDLFDGEIAEELDDTLYRFGRYMGGDMWIDSYQANTSSIRDVDTRLNILEEERGWVPDIIFYDSIEHFIPSNREDHKRDPRIKIQLVYHEAIAMNKRRNTFAFTPSQVNRNAIKKKTFDMTDLSEDFGKAMNAHAIFAICATAEELDQNIRRIIPIAQREGVSYRGNQKNMCVIQVKEATMEVEEVDMEAYLADVADD